MKRKQEISRKRAVIVDKIYPALVEATISIDEAKMFIQAFSSVIMEQVLGWMKERQFAEILPAVLERLSPDGERREALARLLATVENENIFVAKELVEGVTRAIDQMIHDELKGRKLDTLKPEWDRYLN